MVPQNSPPKCDSNFVDAVEALTDGGFKFFVSNGSLLGIVRDGSLIRWDRDIDIVIVGNCSDIRRAGQRLEGVGFNATFLNYPPGPHSVILERGKERRLDIGLLDQELIGGKLFATRRWYMSSIDPAQLTWSRRLVSAALALLHRLGHTCRGLLQEEPTKSRGGEAPCHFSIPGLKRIEMALRQSVGMASNKGYFIEWDRIFPLKILTFFETSVPVPCDPEGVLEAIYGDDWVVPIQSTHWAQFSKLKP